MIYRTKKRYENAKRKYLRNRKLQEKNYYAEKFKNENSYISIIYDSNGRRELHIKN